MAKLDVLIQAIPEPKLRADITHELERLREQKLFGLVFEEHIPELVQLPRLPVKPGSRVVKRGSKLNHTYTVRATNGNLAQLWHEPDGPDETVTTNDLVVVKRFGEPIYPALTPIDRVTCDPDQPYHVLINADNFHALQLLIYCYEGKVDVIYIDPPYNTGARDWKYNNDYVDDSDPWQHSKWLSFMEKRLKLARKLLKTDSVLIVTIDEHEIHNLGNLLAQEFPDARRQMVTIVNNAAGVTQGGFYRVEEYAFFCFFGNTKPVPGNDDLLSDESKADTTPLWFSLIRYGGINSLPSKRPGLVYPIAIDPERQRIVATGRTLKQRVDAEEVSGNLNEWIPDPNEKLNGFPVVWPYRGNGTLSTWQLKPSTLMHLIKEGFVRVRPQTDGPGGNSYSIVYIKSGNRAKISSGAIPATGREPDDGALILGETARNVIPKTVWKRLRHDAGKWGSRTIREVLGNVTFDYAKSPYAVVDTLASVIRDRPNAVILDFFAGSGTTLHATCLLNAEDLGQRQCILVTNNEVTAQTADRLIAHKHFPGDPEFERQGICQSVTWPRCKYVINGHRDDGTELAGAYLNGRETKAGFRANLDYFRLDFLDPDEVAAGERFDAILPILWLMAGGKGERDEHNGAGKWLISKKSPFAVLLDERALKEFVRELKSRGDITHVFLVTDSEDAYHEMCADLPGRYATRMLYKSYLDNFKINLEKAL